MTSEDVKKELLEKDGVSVKEEVDDDFFNDLIGDEEKPEEVDDEFNGLVGEKEEEKPAEEVDDDFFNELIEEDKPEEEEKPTEKKKQKEENEKEEAVFTKHEMALVAKHRTTLPLLIP